MVCVLKVKVRGGGFFMSEMMGRIGNIESNFKLDLHNFLLSFSVYIYNSLFITSLATTVKFVACLSCSFLGKNTIH